MLLMKLRNPTRRRGLECAAMILPGAVRRCEQGRGAVPFVIMALAGEGVSVGSFKLRPLQCLDRELHVILDNLATHKKNERWLKKHSNAHFHFCRRGRRSSIGSTHVQS